MILHPGLEEALEVDKLLDAQKAAAASSTNAGLLEKVEDALETDESENSDSDIAADDSDTSGDGDPDASDAGVDQEDTSASDEAEEVPDEDQELSEAKEGLRGYAVESWEDTSRYAGQAFDAVKYIGMLGLSFTAKAASTVFKGLYTALGYLSKQLFKSIYAITKYLERRATSVSVLNQDIEGLRNSIAQIQEQEKEVDLENQVFDNNKIINDLKIADSVDFTANINTLASFIDTLVKDFDVSLKNDIASVEYIIASVSRYKLNIPNKELNSPIFNSVAFRWEDTETEGLVRGKYDKVLPGDKVYLIEAPKKLANTMDQAHAAYRQAGVCLEMNDDSFKDVAAVPYLPLDKLTEMVDSLDKATKLLEQHVKYYEALKGHKLKLRFSFKDYAKLLLANSYHGTIKESLIDLITVKTAYIDKVYLVGAMDAHDYLSLTIAAGIRFAKDNIRKLQ